MILAALTGAEDLQLLHVTRGHLAQQRKEVVRDTLGILAHDTAGVGSARVEVPQKGAVPLLIRLVCLLEVPPLCLHVVGYDLLDHGLCTTICVCGANWAVLGDGNHILEASRIAVDGGRGREDDVGHIVLAHGAQERNATANIDTVVFERDDARFTDSLFVR